MQPSACPRPSAIGGVDEKPFVSMGTSEEGEAQSGGGWRGCWAGSVIRTERLSEAPLIDCRHGF